jgi:hypothetical protein
MQFTIIQQKIYEIRGQKVMLDKDLADLYDIPTKSLNLSVRRNKSRFPADFMFQLTRAEFKNLRFQIETSSWGGTRYMPYAFTELGVAMLSSILNSSKAVSVNIAIMRVFVLLRQYALDHKDLVEKIAKLERRHNKRFKDVYEALNLLLQNHKNKKDWESRQRIGFKQ